MERADKIFTALGIAGLIGLLCWQRKTIAGPNINTSALPAVLSDTGPAYLLSALPSHRRRDEFAPPTSN